MDEELITLSNEIFRDIISQLTLNLRFMDIALNRFVFVPDALEFRCDGKYFHYHPLAVIKKFQNNPKELTRGYFHIVLHAVFLHAFFSENRTPSLWNLACDIAVENVILDLHLPCMAQPDDSEKRRAIDRLKKDMPSFTAQAVYLKLMDLERDEIRLLAPLFAFDNHEIWYHFRDVHSSSETLFGEETHDNPSQATGNTFDKASHDTGERKEIDEAAADAEIERMKNILKDWKEISEKIETDLETFSKDLGDKTSAMVQSLKKLHREKYDYTRFLKKFMRPGEKLQISDTDFDAIFYTYGLRLYHNLPLIEPLEFKDINNVRELVIAIDTSGSVQGDIVQAFLQKTWSIFQQQENFFSRFHIHILQCDMLIRDIAVITSKQQFETYIKDLEIKGLGGTDFRPVFRYCNEQLEKGTFKNLGGLLYFTDGDGAYPKHRPPYTTAFLFLEGNKDITVPPWAIRCILEREEFHAYSESQTAD